MPARLRCPPVQLSKLPCISSTVKKVYILFLHVDLAFIKMIVQFTYLIMTQRHEIMRCNIMQYYDPSPPPPQSPPPSTHTTCTPPHQSAHPSSRAAPSSATPAASSPRTFS